MKKRILYIDYLDNISLVIGIILKPFFNKIFFHNAKKLYQSKKIKMKLERIGIHWLSYYDIPFNIYFDTYHNLNPKLSDAVFKNCFGDSIIYSKIIEYFKLDVLGVKKLEASLKKKILGDLYHEEGTSSLSLIGHKFEKNCNIFYMPRFFNNYLLAKEYEDNVTPISLHLIIYTSFDLILKVIKLFLKSAKTIFNEKIYFNLKQKKKIILNNSYSRSNKYEIAFVPHKGIKYSIYFKKNYLYENLPKSIFYKKKLLTIEFEKADNISERYYRINKIPHYIFKNTKMTVLLLDVLKLVKKVNLTKSIIKIFSPKNLYSSIIILLYFTRVVNFNHFLAHFPFLKLIYFHYDILVSTELILACHMRNIKTVSAQERPNAYCWATPIIYDHYLITGSQLINDIKDKGHIISKFHSIGLPRSSYITSKNYYNKFDKIKKTHKLVICFDNPIFNRFYSGINGGVNSEETKYNFYRNIIYLAKEYPKIYFVFKPKSIESNDGVEQSFFKNIESESNEVKNFEIIKNLKKYNSYKLASQADLIIGSYSTMLVECFAAKKKVLIYDDNLQYYKFFLSGINIVENSFEGLKKRFFEIIEQNNYLKEEEWMDFGEKYFFNFKNGINGFQLIKENIKKIYEENKSLPYKKHN